MASTIFSLFALTALITATPTSLRIRDASYVSNDMVDVIAGNRACASTAVIFARGTFDSIEDSDVQGHIGIWLGPRLKEALQKELNGDVSFQGLNTQDYPAILKDYGKEGGSESGANAIASTIEAYTTKCPQSSIIVSGWSQGALISHKSLERINANSFKQVKALVTFGDENKISDNIPIPAGVAFKDWCVEDNLAPDVLCTDSLTSGIRIPRTINDLRELLNQSWASLPPDFATTVEQAKATKGLFKNMLKELMDPEVVGYFLADVLRGKVRRWIVLPQHFVYANNGMVDDAASWLAQEVLSI